MNTPSVYEGLPDNDAFGFQPPPCPQPIGADLFDKCGLPRFYFVHNLKSPEGLLLRSHQQGNDLFNTGRIEAETFWGNELSIFNILHYERDDWREPLPFEVSKSLSACNANELQGTCDDHNHVLQWTFGPGNRPLYTSIWVCPPNLERIALALFDILKPMHAAPLIENHSIPNSLLLTEIHYVYIRRACTAGANDIEHSDIWNALYLLLKKLNPFSQEYESEKQERHQKILLSQFDKAVIDIEEFYGPICGSKKGALWAEINESGLGK